MYNIGIRTDVSKARLTSACRYGCTYVVYPSTTLTRIHCMRACNRRRRSRTLYNVCAPSCTIRADAPSYTVQVHARRALYERMHEKQMRAYWAMKDNKRRHGCTEPHVHPNRTLTNYREMYEALMTPNSNSTSLMVFNECATTQQHELLTITDTIILSNLMITRNMKGYYVMID